MVTHELRIRPNITEWARAGVSHLTRSWLGPKGTGPWTNGPVAVNRIGGNVQEKNGGRLCRSGWQERK